MRVTELDPEKYYERFIGHTKKCSVCRDAGGEWAGNEHLCSVGRLLSRAWGEAEEQYAKAEGR